MNTVDLYKNDFYAWTQWPAQALVARTVAELDWENLQKELEFLDKQEYREFVSRLAGLVGICLNGSSNPVGVAVVGS
jgi:hypothetical protein